MKGGRAKRDCVLPWADPASRTGSRTVQKHQVKERRQMRTNFLSAFFFAVLALPVAHAQDINADIYGNWKITAILGGGIGSLKRALSLKRYAPVISRPLHPASAGDTQPVTTPAQMSAHQLHTPTLQPA
jgi:hypothetical protein